MKELQGPRHEKRFQAVLSGANNVIFIKTNLPDSKDPTDLVHTILTDMLKTGCKKTRLVLTTIVFKEIMAEWQPPIMLSSNWGPK